MKIFFYRLSKVDYEILGEIEAHSNNIWKIVKMSDNRIASLEDEQPNKNSKSSVYKSNHSKEANDIRRLESFK